jgi:hypothetical protein
VTGIEAGGAAVPARACLADDPRRGAVYIVTGGAWGLRLKAADDLRPWSLADSGQWGEPYLLLPGDGSQLRFDE